MYMSNWDVNFGEVADHYLELISTNSMAAAKFGSKSVSSALQNIRGFIPVIVYRLRRCGDKDIKVLKYAFKKVSELLDAHSEEDALMSTLEYYLIVYSEMWESPTPDLATMTARVLILSGKLDPQTPHKYVERLLAALDGPAARKELVTFELTPHGAILNAVYGGRSDEVMGFTITPSRFCAVELLASYVNASGDVTKIDKSCVALTNAERSTLDPNGLYAGMFLNTRDTFEGEVFAYSDKRLETPLVIMSVAGGILLLVAGCCLAEFQSRRRSGHELHAEAAAFARRPTDKEMIILYHLQKKLFTRLVESPEHLGLLKRYWELSFGNRQLAPAFARKSVCWHREGGFSSDNPADDLRAMGELGLESLLFFAENYPGEAAMMKRVRGGYPFVKAALACARALCEIFRLVDEDSHVGKFPVTRTLYWQILESEASFFELFSLLFLLFDELFCEEVATNTSLQDELVCSTAVVARLVDAAKLKLLQALVKAPMRVDDLLGLCNNAFHALNRKAARASAATGAAASHRHQFAASSIKTAPVSLWKKQTPVGEVKRPMNKSADCGDECLNRLQPRRPHISFSPSIAASKLLGASREFEADEEEEEEKDEERQSEPEVETNLFKGLVVASKTPALLESLTAYNGVPDNGLTGNRCAAQAS
ncbi:hypothetical protein PybrP1_010853 [[Pythium] brassicae (nom. inval.)]|nr:hypothetical protein PybrP1_010853 [[Pythium] brassicae (nom. inval.)]